MSEPSTGASPSLPAEGDGVRRPTDPSRAASASTSATAAATSATTSMSTRSSTRSRTPATSSSPRPPMFACSDATQSEMVADIEANELDGLVVASCSPKLHTFTFRGVASARGPEPVRVHPGQHPRAVLVGPHRRPGRRHRRRRPALVRAGIGRTRETDAARADRRRHDPAHARDRRRHRRPPGRDRPRRHRAPGDARRARARSSAAGSAASAPMYPHDRNGPRPHRSASSRRSAAAPRSRSSPAPRSSASPAASATTASAIRIGGRRARTIAVAVGSIVVATGFDTYQPDEGEFGFGIEGVDHPPRVQGDGGRGHGAARPARAGRSAASPTSTASAAAARRAPTRTARASAAPRRSRRPSQVVRPRPVDPPVPPLPRHAHLRQVRAALHRGPQAGSVFVKFDDDAPPAVDGRARPAA